MRRPADVEAEAQAAGLQVEQLAEVTLPSGERALAARLSFDDPWAAVRLLCDRAAEDANDPRVRVWALALLRAAADTIGHEGPTVTAPLARAAARSLHASVQRSIRYVVEPRETFQSAAVTMELQAGDCDDHAALVYALAHAMGMPARICILTDAEGEPVHAVAKLYDGSAWQWAETTIPAGFGEDPQAAFARCKREGLIASRANL